jgi:CubicO group peptidase (beta-lactamase class C family)
VQEGATEPHRTVPSEQRPRVQSEWDRVVLCGTVIRTASFSALFALLWTLPATAEPSALAARLADHADAHADQRNFKGSVLVVKDGQVLLDRHFGVEQRVRFRIGSVTKSFTGVAMLQLEATGKLELSDPVCRYVRDCPAAWRPVTLHHLLTHTSGIPSFTALPDYAQFKAQPATALQSARRVSNRPLEFEPGARFEYSNTGYVLLGHVIEQVSKKSFGAYVKDHISRPAGLAATVVGDPKQGLAQGLAPNDLPAAPVDMSVPHAAGAITSTTHDLLRFANALDTDVLLKAKDRARLFTPPEQDGYAYGWHTQPIGGKPAQWHSGGIDGFSALLVRVPEEKLVVVTLSNQETPSRLGRELVALAVGVDVPAPVRQVEIQVPGERLQTLVGRYQLSPGFELAVTLEGMQLFAQATGQPRFPLFAEADDRFFLKVVAAKLHFERDETGAVTGLVLHQDGQVVPAALLP